MTSSHMRADTPAIPNGWSSKTLGELGKFKNGINKSAEDFGHGHPLVNLLDVFGRSNLSLGEPELGLVNSSEDDRRTYDLKEGDFLFVRSSVKPDGIGLTTLVSEDLPNTVFSGFLLRFRMDGELLGKFAEHCFFLEGFRKSLISSSTVSANTNINQSSLKKLSISFPKDKVEQSAIASALSDVDALLAAQDALIAKERAINQGAMQELLTGKRRLPGFSGEWEVKSLEEVAKLSKEGIDPSATPEALFTHFSLPAFDALEAPVVEVGASIGSNKFVVPQGAVLLSKLNPRIPRVWAPNEVPSNSVCSTEFLVLVPNESVDTGFLLLACRSGHVSAQMELHAIGTTGSHQRIHPRQALKIKIPIPKDPGEQSEISKVMSDMATEITALEAQRAKTAQLKQGMMQALLTGRIRLV